MALAIYQGFILLAEMVGLHALVDAASTTKNAKAEIKPNAFTLVWCLIFDAVVMTALIVSMFS